MVDEQRIYAIERPHPRLLKLYLVRSFSFPPFSLLGLPMLFFRYHTMRYHFDEEGVSMRWGILFRREINLTYARIQDIHLTSGPVQRWLGLADLHIQTASGNASAEMTVEGLLEFEVVRDFLYSRMRGVRGESRAAPAAPPAVDAAPVDASPGGADAALRDVCDELRAARQALDSLADAMGRDQ